MHPTAPPPPHPRPAPRGRRIGRRALLAVLAAALGSGAAAAKPKLRVGITLHPYYSWAVNITQGAAEIVPLIDAGFDVHNYEPQAADIRRAATLDVLIMNGIGHDDFALKILDAAEVRGKVRVIYANEGVALIPASGSSGGEKVYNPHTFIAITAAIQQIFTIATQLGEADPDNAEAYRRNARAYAAKLRKLKAGFAARIAGVPAGALRVATIHGGYDYLMQEFGLDVVAVVEPAHGLLPTASQMRGTIERIKALHVNTLFTQAQYPAQFAETIQRETGARLYTLTHITEGAYTAEKFEEGIAYDMQVITDAVLAANAAAPAAGQ